MPPTLLADFERIERDELRHGQLFELFAQTFDTDDHLAEDQTAEKLGAAIGKIGEEFLPKRMRSRSALESPLGSGGDVFVMRGESRDEKESVFDRIVNACGLLSAIDARATHLGKRRDQMTVAIKECSAHVWP